jgi:hypothetical protein
MPNGTFSLTVNHQHSGRKRVLLIGFEPSIQESISVLLNTMGWASKVLSDLGRLGAGLQQGSFEAVLLSLRHSAEELERMILQIKEIRPTLSERVVVVSRGAVAPEILELIERYDLSHLRQEKVFSQLWSTLEDLVAFPPCYRVAARDIGVARLLYDSLRTPGLIGVRSSDTSGRHFIYEHNNTTIDVQLDVQPGSNRISLMGQVLDGTKPSFSYENRAVILHARNGTLARTTTNRQGEFVMQFDFAENVNLEIRVGERSWISVPSIQLDWAREQMRRRSGT